MLIAVNPSDGWKCVATLEVVGRTPSLESALGEIRDQYRITPAKESPPGYTWLDVFVDFSFGERRAWRVAYAILTALQDVASEGLIEGYRLVTGQLYLAVGSNATRAYAAQSGEKRAHLTGPSACA